MKPAASTNRCGKNAGSEDLAALPGVATAWSPRLRGLDGLAATLRTANSLGSRSASSRPRTPTAYAKYIGRVGALAVALGIGGAIATAPGVAWADEPSPTASESPTAPESKTPPEHSTVDESGGQSGTSPSSSKIVTKRWLHRHFGEKRRDDESGVIVHSFGGSHTAGADNQSVRGRQEDEAGAPDLEQRITPAKEVAVQVTPAKEVAVQVTPEGEVALQEPPEIQVTTPPAARTRTVVPPAKNSDTKQVAPLAARTWTVAPTGKASDTRQVASRLADAHAVRTELGDAGLQLWASAVTATAGETDEWNDQSVGATFTTPPAFASSARELVDLIDDDLAPLEDPGPMGPGSSVMWAVLGSAWRQFTQRFGKHTPVADLAQTTQVEPLDPEQPAPVERVSALIDAGVAEEQVGLVAQAALIEAPTTTSIFFGASPRIGEANGTVMVPIVRTGDLNRVTTIEYGVTSDTATAGVDYVFPVGPTGTITMGADVDRVYIPVQIINDNVSEPTETFVVSIINVDSGYNSFSANGAHRYTG